MVSITAEDMLWEIKEINKDGSSLNHIAKSIKNS